MPPPSAERPTAAGAAPPTGAAVVAPPARAEALRHDAHLRTIMEEALLATHPYDLRSFGDEGEAMAWLLA